MHKKQIINERSYVLIYYDSRNYNVNRDIPRANHFGTDPGSSQMLVKYNMCTELIDVRKIYKNKTVQISLPYTFQSLTFPYPYDARQRKETVLDS